MAKISPCLWFNGDAEAAVEFYVSVVPDSRILHVQRNVMDSPGGKAGTVLVIEFVLAGQKFVAINGGMKVEYTHALSLAIDCETQAEVDRLWAGLTADGGKPVQCGWLTDRYGISWQVVPTALPRLLGDPDPVKAGRVMQAMLGMVKLDVARLEAAWRGDAA
ncbi:VOC family protein [Aliidongia dinghuensis]|uniref:VOC family protein n=1 Tax=Aliidongia dinghuensis TaxID=1867774 RepID=A0A8J2Z1C3_9PROT|nr:VOC family protein [Aliidongia dinghuensis]GGF51318.1 VOC family protein [Aliidongia dinghuensis]